MIENKCAWEKQRRHVLRKILQESAREKGEFGYEIANMVIR
jgi:DNA-binding TFAR19-related protein (PDSD5 family)